MLDVKRKEKNMGISMIIDFIALLLCLVGVVMVYDARVITKRLFGFGDQNQAALVLKILGFIIAMIGCLLIYF